MKALISISTMTKPAVALAIFGLAILACPLAQADGKKTQFSGTEENYDPNASPGVWYADAQNTFVFGRECIGDENVSDLRLKGRGYFRYPIVANSSMSSGAFWGTARIVPTIGGGEWNGYFVARVAPETMTLVMTLTGSGAYAGLVARLTDTPRTDGQPGFHIEGYIVEAKGGPSDRPFQMRACRTERLEAHPCSFLPWGLPGPEEATVLRADIVSEIGQATHLGLTANEGFAVVDPATGAVTGTGIATAANMDQVFWVYFGTLAPNGVAQGQVHFCGGTGQFDAAVGGFKVGVKADFEPTGQPRVWEADYCYSANGTIRY
jgi:hypothetical protein